MSREAIFYRSTGFGKERLQCYLLFNLGLFKIIRFETHWTDSDEYSWRTRIKFFWNVEEL